MNTVSTESPPAKAGNYRAILWGGLLAGTLDLTAACVNNASTRGPLWVMQSVAAGVLGQNTFKGGLATAALGVALHFLIATSAAAVYWAASRRIKLLAESAIVCGAAYGVAVFLVMNWIVVPLSAIGRRIPYTPTGLVVMVFIHILFVGLPIALIVRRYSKSPRPAPND